VSSSPGSPSHGNIVRARPTRPTLSHGKPSRLDHRPPRAKSNAQFGGHPGTAQGHKLPFGFPQPHPHGHHYGPVVRPAGEHIPLWTTPTQRCLLERHPHRRPRCPRLAAINLAGIP
jgi:hypothetical protein